MAQPTKTFITGTVGTGKSTLARRISKELTIPCHHLDQVIYILDPTTDTGNRKRTDAERDEMINDILAQPAWVAEDAGRAIFEPLWQQADIILLLEPPIPIRNFRIFSRWVKQRLGLEKCGYSPGFWMLRNMYKWSANYDTGKDGLKERLAPYWGKVCVMRGGRDLERFLNS